MSETNEDKNKKERSYIPALIFYPFAIVFFELTLKFMDDYNSPWNISLPVTIFFSSEILNHCYWHQVRILSELQHRNSGLQAMSVAYRP